MTPKPKPNGALTIHSVTMKNLMRVRSVEQTFDRNQRLIVVGGKNAQGKTSFMDGLEAAFTTGKISDRPIHDGAKRGEETITLMDGDGNLVYTVEKIVRPSGTEVTVYDAEGHVIPDARALLDDLIDKGYGFDPAQFAKLSDTVPGRRQQFEMLRDLLGLDFAAHDAERQKVFDERTGMNTTVKSLTAQLQATTHYPDAPEKEVSLQALSQQLHAASQQQVELAGLRQQYLNRQEAVLAKRARIKELHDEASRLIQQATLMEGECEAEEAALAETKAAGQKLAAAVIDPKPLQAQLATIEETNKKVRENQKHADLTATLGDAQAKAKALTETLETMDAEKSRQIAAAPMPIPDLSLDYEQGHVLYAGRPLSVASTAEQIRVSVAMGIAMLKRLKVILIREGSHLDDDNLRLIGEMAKAADVQVFTEKVGSDGASFIMEDGEAVSVEEPTLADRERAAEAGICSVCGLAWDACQCVDQAEVEELALPADLVGSEPGF